MDQRRRKRILVAGGAGFIGSHLCEQLLLAGHEVLCLDNFRTASPDNVAHLQDNPYFDLVHHDVTVALSAEVDEIYNLACPASPVHYQHDPVRTLRTNVLGALNLLELGRCTGAPVLQASTSEVYGDPLVHPQREDYWGHVNPVGVRACYDEGKRCAETLFMDFRRQYRTCVKIARIFNTYGPRLQPDDGRVVSNLVVQALRNRPLTVYGDGSQTRSFCYVDDMVDALMRLMDTPAGVTGPVNLGNPEETTILELAREILRQTGSRSRIVFQPLPQDDPAQRRPDIGEAENLLSWKPATPLREGLARTIAYFESALTRPRASAWAL